MSTSIFGSDGAFFSDDGDDDDDDDDDSIDFEEVDFEFEDEAAILAANAASLAFRWYRRRLF